MQHVTPTNDNEESRVSGLSSQSKLPSSYIRVTSPKRELTPTRTVSSPKRSEAPTDFGSTNTRASLRLKRSQDTGTSKFYVNQGKDNPEIMQSYSRSKSFDLDKNKKATTENS